MKNISRFAVIFVLFLFWSLQAVGQNGSNINTHGRVMTIAQDTLTVGLTSGWTVRVGVEGTVFRLVRRGGQSRAERIAKIRVAEVDHNNRFAKCVIVDFTQSIELNQTVEFPRALRLGTLLVNSNRSGAAVTVDDKPAGGTIRNRPLEIGLAPGRHQVSVTKPGYETRRRIVDILPGQEQSINMFLYPQEGELVVTTSPSGASISLDDVPLGVTPVSQNVPPGKYLLKVEYNGYNTVTQNIEVIAGQEAPGYRFELEPQGGSLTVTSIPEGALVLLNNETFGNTPVTALVSPGRHRIQVIKNGYQVEERSVNIATDGAERIAVNLKESVTILADGELSVTSVPSAVRVLINGRQVGTTPLSISQAPGTYEVKFEKRGFDSESIRVVVESEKMRRVTGGPLTPWVTAVPFDSSGAVVDSFRYSFERDGRVLFTYRLAGDASRYQVDMLISQDGGETFVLAPSIVSGDIGTSVSAGDDRLIVWDSRIDFPDGLEAKRLVVKFSAVKQRMSKLWWLAISGAVAAGAGALFFTLSEADIASTPGPRP